MKTLYYVHKPSGGRLSVKAYGEGEAPDSDVSLDRGSAKVATVVGYLDHDKYDAELTRLGWVRCGWLRWWWAGVLMGRFTSL